MAYLNLADMFFKKRQELPDHTGYKRKVDGSWEDITFKEAVDLTERIAGGLASCGISAGDTVALISKNRLEWALIDYAVLCLGAVLVPIYPTLTKAQIKYILDDCKAKLLIVEDIDQVDKVTPLCDELQHVGNYFIIDSEEGKHTNRWQIFESLAGKGDTFIQLNPDYISSSIKNIKKADVATIIYTSGTTGEPKGVILTHNNFLSNVEGVSQLFDCYPEDIFLSFLPLSHIFERTAGQFFACYHGATVAYAESIDMVAANIQEIRPTLMVSVPRLYEKMYSRVLETAETGSPLKRKLFYWSVKNGRRYMKTQNSGQPVSLTLKIKYSIASILVFSKLKKRVGGRLRYFVSGGAPLAAEIGEFFDAAGLIILEGYGLTETSPGITFNHPDSYRFGTVGMPLPGVEVKIAEDGEILTRGDHVMQGYLNKEDLTREAIDPEGWFYTGDIGFIDEEGFLIITDRKKNLIVTSGGKNIAPQPIENVLITSRFIEQAVVIGDKRRFCSAIIVPVQESLMHLAKEKDIQSGDYEELINHPEILALIHSEIDRLTEDYASFEKIQKFIVVSKPFSEQSGELTPSLKIKRNLVEKNYKSQIDKLYDIVNTD